MARRTVCVKTKGILQCLIELAITMVNIGIGVWCGLDDNPDLIAFYVAILLQGISNAYDYMCFFAENKNNITRWFRNVIVIITFLQIVAITVCFVCLVKGFIVFWLSVAICILVTLPLLLLLYELAYHMTK